MKKDRPYYPACAEIPGEEWRPAAGFEDLYEASSMGRIRRAVFAPKGRCTRPGKLLFPCFAQGYARATLRPRKNKAESILVHRVIAQTFLGAARPGTQVNHKNGIKADNRLENLEWVTRHENILHAWRTGLAKPARCERASRASLTNREAAAILRLRANTEIRVTELADAFDVPRSTVASLCAGRTWKSLSLCQT